MQLRFNQAISPELVKARNKLHVLIVFPVSRKFPLVLNLINIFQFALSFNDVNS